MSKSVEKRVPRMVTIGICTGCNFVVLPGPRFQRRIVQHLRTIQHNHDACVLSKVHRDEVPSIRKVLDLVESSNAQEMARVKARIVDVLRASLTSAIPRRS